MEMINGAHPIVHDLTHPPTHLKCLFFLDDRLDEGMSNPESSSQVGRDLKQP
jgi:hypothetical protein